VNRRSTQTGRWTHYGARYRGADGCTPARFFLGKSTYRSGSWEGHRTGLKEVAKRNSSPTPGIKSRLYGITARINSIARLIIISVVKEDKYHNTSDDRAN
jgi:hypothetical protein